MDLENYYKLNFNLFHEHKFSLESVEEMIPWERDVYMILLKQWIEEENQRLEKQRSKYK
jgi:hypothetical protein